MTNCVISSNTAAFKFGTPSRAGFRNIAISNCAVYECGIGVIKLEIVDGGDVGGRGDLQYRDAQRRRADFCATGQSRQPVRCAQRGVRSPPTRFPWARCATCSISNVRATVRNVYVDDPMERVDVPGQAMLGMLISGIPGHPVEGLTLSDIHVTFPGGGTLEDAAIDVPEDEKMYPERFFFGVLPAYGAFIRHAKGVAFHNVRFELADRDLRPALVCEDVVDLELDGFRAMGDAEAEAVVRLKNVQE